MELRVSQVAFGLERGVLGATPRRMGVWTQGCSLPKCPGCVSTHTWSADGGRSIPIASLLGLARAQRMPPSGLTVSGGEPTDQAVAVAALAEGFRAGFPDAELVLYTGLRWRVFAARFRELAARFDTVVAGPYVRTREATPLAGSNNQEVRLLSPRAERLYAGWASWPLHALQVGQCQGDRLVTVGIPNTTRMKQAVRQVGVVGVTWDQDEQRRRP
jgi:anaerobic ribonucleoside-triphosphate reductase activating protein